MRFSVARGLVGVLLAGVTAWVATACTSPGADSSPRQEPSEEQPVTSAGPPAGKSRPLIDYLTHPRLRPGQPCPLTQADQRAVVPEPMRELLNGDPTGAYGGGPLWVLLPADGPNAARVQGHFHAKIGWYVGTPGLLRGAARRLDANATSTGQLDVADPQTRAPRMQPSSLIVPAEGCWQVAGTVGDQVLVFVMRVRADRR